MFRSRGGAPKSADGVTYVLAASVCLGCGVWAPIPRDLWRAVSNVARFRASFEFEGLKACVSRRLALFFLEFKI